MVGHTVKWLIFLVLASLVSGHSLCAADGTHADILDTIRSNDDAVRSRGIKELSDMTRPYPEYILKGLIAILEDNRELTRTRLAAAFVITTPDIPLNAYSTKLSDIAKSHSNPLDVRAGALRALLQTDSSLRRESVCGRTWLAILVDKLDAPEVRAVAASCLGECSNLAPTAIEDLLLVLEETGESSDLRIRIVDTLSHAMFYSASNRIPDIAARLLMIAENPKERVHLREKALNGLFDAMFYADSLSEDRYQELCMRFSRPLCRLVVSESVPRSLQVAALSVLRLLPSVDGDTVRPIAQLLDEPVDERHEGAVVVLGQLTVKAKDALPNIERLWRRKGISRELKQALEEAIESIDSKRARSLGIDSRIPSKNSPP